MWRHAVPSSSSPTYIKTRQWLFYSADIGAEIYFMFLYHFKGNSNICDCVHWMLISAHNIMFHHHLRPMPGLLHHLLLLGSQEVKRDKCRLFRSRTHFKEDSTSVSSTISNCHFNLISLNVLDFKVSGISSYFTSSLTQNGQGQSASVKGDFLHCFYFVVDHWAFWASYLLTP